MDFEAEWARCGPWLEPALDHAGGTHRLSDVKALVCDPDEPVRFWAGERAALVTEVRDCPAAKVLVLWLGGGDLAEIAGRLVPAAEAWGREQGCDRMMIVGRRGWARALSGYETRAAVMVKELAA